MNSHGGDQPIFFDAFNNEKEIYVLAPPWRKSHPKCFNEDDISFFVGEEKITPRGLFIKEYEGYRLFVYDYKIKEKTQCKIQIPKKNVDKTFFLDLHKKEKKHLALSTLFKGDFRKIPTFYKLFKSQGVDSFYLYYNGIANDEIKRVCNLPDVTLINWPFAYRCHGITGAFHFAQPAQICHAFHKYVKYNYKYFINCDLDEWMSPQGGISLRELTEKYKNINYFLFNNHYVSGDTPDSIPNSLNVDVGDNKDYYTRSSRSKYMIKVSDVLNYQLGVHDVFVKNVTTHPNPRDKENHHKLLHFYDRNHDGTVEGRTKHNQTYKIEELFKNLKK